MTRYVMVADLERCVGCQTCVAACRHANATSPAVQWRQVLDIEAGEYPAVSRTFVPVGCQHCQDPPCMHVCPTTATRKRPDGIVTVDYALCIGCAYCDVACPYQARFKIDRARFAYGKETPTERATADVRRAGVSQKCTFCVDRIDAGLAQGLVPGADPRATPACVNSCIADALTFGDAEDAESNVSRLLRDNAHFRMHAELGTAPNFYYLQDHRHAGAPAAAGPIRGQGVEPRHQQHWDWKAAANFVLGGCGAALFVFAFAIGERSALFAAVVLVALGLSILFLKIGRPLRFLYVLRQPRRSWMSREAWVAAAFFPLAAWFLATGTFAAGLAAATAAGLFLVAQAMILKEAKGVPAWRSRAVVPLIIVTGLAEAAGLLTLFGPQPTLLAVFVVLRGLAWHFYLRALERAGAPRRALAVLRRWEPWMQGSGTLAPLLLVALGVLLDAAVAVAIAGASAVAVGWAMKFILVTRAGFQQGFALERAGATLKPGWSEGKA
jgi:phenylacetyl-CoA:acceptor oxidoreductase subunit 1